MWDLSWEHETHEFTDPRQGTRERPEWQLHQLTCDSEKQDISNAAEALNNPPQKAQYMEAAILEPPAWLAFNLTDPLRPLAIWPPSPAVTWQVQCPWQGALGNLGSFTFSRSWIWLSIPISLEEKPQLRRNCHATDLGGPRLTAPDCSYRSHCDCLFSMCVKSESQLYTIPMAYNIRSYSCICSLCLTVDFL